MSHNNELPIPPIALQNDNAKEIARIWAAGGAQHITLSAPLWSDPAMWGIMLVDLSKLVADAYNRSGDFDRTDALARIKSGFDAEWTSATDEPFGDFASQ